MYIYIYIYIERERERDTGPAGGLLRAADKETYTDKS